MDRGRDSFLPIKCPFVSSFLRMILSGLTADPAFFFFLNQHLMSFKSAFLSSLANILASCETYDMTYDTVVRVKYE